MITRTLFAMGLLAVGALVVPSRSEAQTRIGRGRNLGVGIALGYPNVGLAFNGYFRETFSLQIDVTWSYRSGYGFAGGRADALFWMPALATADWGMLRWYVGPGAFVGVVTGTYYGPRNAFRSRGFFLGAEAALGIALQFKIPIDVTLEVVPQLHLVDSDGFFLGADVAAALHARYYF
jgi:hypothetical protein